MTSGIVPRMFYVSSRSVVAVAFFALLLSLSSDTCLAGQRRARAQRPAPPERSKAKPSPTITPEPEVQLEKLPPDPSVEAADVAITANVRAKSLVFEVVPNPTVTFPSKPASDTVWEAQRENLPTPVEPGVTYRNIGIRLKITSVFRDIDRIVAEALGEVPITNDAKPPAAEAAQPSGPKATATPAPSPPRSQKK